MTNVTAYTSVDMTNANLYRLTAGAVSTGTYANVTLNGIFYPTAVEVDWLYNGSYFASLFGGVGITTATIGGKFTITGGTLTGYEELYSSGGQWVPSYAFENVSFPAVNIYNATQTVITHPCFEAWFFSRSGFRPAWRR